MNLSKAELGVLSEILSTVPCQVMMFGSRAKGVSRPDSDLDLCLKPANEDISLAEIGRLREAFEMSSLPFLVDLVVYHDLPFSFQDQIDREGIILKEDASG